MIVKIYSDKKYSQNTIVVDNETRKLYKVLSCLDKDWLTKGKEKGYLVTLKEVRQ